jgi:hypothetical protein
MTSFKLGENDCAIILKDNNEVEIILPKYEDDEEEVSENMLLAVGVVALIPTPEFQKLLSKRITEVLDKVDKKKEKEETE